MYFLVLEDIINPENCDVVFPAGAIIGARSITRLYTELGVDNFQSQVCIDWSAALHMRAYLFPYLAGDAEELHEGVWPVTVYDFEIKVGGGARVLLTGNKVCHYFKKSRQPEFVGRLADLARYNPELMTLLIHLGAVKVSA